MSAVERHGKIKSTYSLFVSYKLEPLVGNVHCCCRKVFELLAPGSLSNVDWMILPRSVLDGWSMLITNYFKVKTNE